jgi:hypothetical protein
MASLSSKKQQIHNLFVCKGEDAEGIIYYFHGENFMHVRPLVEPARLMVDKEDAEDAKELLKGLNLSIMGINFRQEDKE